MLSWIAENFDRGTHAVIALVLCVQYSVAEHGRQMEAILTMRLQRGTETPKAPERTIEYEVVGLPPGHEARIALFDDRWKIIHSDNGTRGEWVGSYESAAAALAALQEALEED
jgi:hypothetical protein